MRYVFYSLILITIVVGGIFLFKGGNDLVKKIATLISEQQALKDGWMRAEVQLRDQQNMIERIKDLDSTIAQSQRKTIQAIGEMKIELAQIKGGGTGELTEDVARFSDSLISIEYLMRDQLFGYELKRQSVSLIFYRPASGKWQARLEDTAGVASKLFTISKFRVDEREPTPPAWWKRIQIGGGAGYYDTPFLLASVGYGHHHLMPMGGLDHDLKTRWGGAYLFTF